MNAQRTPDATRCADSECVTQAGRWIALLTDPARPADTLSRLACELGVDASTITRWRAGTLRPSAQSLQQLRTLYALRRAAPTLCEAVWSATDEDFAALVGGLQHRACTPAEAPRYRTLVREGVSA